MVAIKNYLTTDLEAAGPEPPRKRRRRYFFRGLPKLATRRNAGRAFREIYQRLMEDSFGNRPNVSNICLLLVNEKRTSRYLKNSGINKFCDHTLVFSGEDEINMAAIRKKICPEAQIIRGMWGWKIDWLHLTKGAVEKLHNARGGGRSVRLCYDVLHGGGGR